MLIDTHCHLHDREFFSETQAEEMLKRAGENDVRRIICIGTSHEDSLAACEFAKGRPGVYWTYGVHPENANKAEAPDSHSGPRRSLPSTKVVCSSSLRKDEQARLSLASSGSLPWGLRANSRVAALRNAPSRESGASGPIGIGEVGLDYHYDGYDREAQIRLFEEMLQLAVDNDLPVSFHIREAFSDFFPVIANFPKVRGVVHSFSDSKKNLRRILEETDFYVGVNGMATYSTLPTPPLERILLETDAPFLTPVPFRGIINESGYIRNIAEWLSARLATDFNTVERETTKNAEQLFRFDGAVIQA